MTTAVQHAGEPGTMSLDAINEKMKALGSGQQLQIAVSSTAKQDEQANAVTYEDLQRLVFEANKGAIAQCLQQVGASEANVAYSGGGDCGGVDEVHIVEPSEELNVVDGTRWEFQTCYGPHGIDTVITAVPINSSLALEAALTSLLWDAIAVCGRYGWENNDGANGSMRVQLQEEGLVVELEHTTVYTTTDTDTFTL